MNLSRLNPIKFCSAYRALSLSPHFSGVFLARASPVPRASIRGVDCAGHPQGPRGIPTDRRGALVRIEVPTRAKTAINAPHGHFRPALHRGPRCCPPAGVVFIARPWCAVLALWRVGMGGLDLNPNSPQTQDSWEHYALATLRCIHVRRRFDSSNRTREYEL